MEWRIVLPSIYRCPSHKTRVVYVCFNRCLMSSLHDGRCTTKRTALWRVNGAASLEHVLHVNCMVAKPYLEKKRFAFVRASDVASG